MVVWCMCCRCVMCFWDVLFVNECQFSHPSSVPESSYEQCQYSVRISAIHYSACFSLFLEAVNLVCIHTHWCQYDLFSLFLMYRINFSTQPAAVPLSQNSVCTSVEVDMSHSLYFFSFLLFFNTPPAAVVVFGVGWSQFRRLPHSGLVDIIGDSALKKCTSRFLVSD